MTYKYIHIYMYTLLYIRSIYICVYKYWLNWSKICLFGRCRRLPNVCGLVAVELKGVSFTHDNAAD